MTDIAIRTRHACPECDNMQVYLWLTRLYETINHPDHGTMDVAEGVIIDGDDEFRVFSNNDESGPEYVCFSCGWVS
jgi:predicted RNA-binding Zn-ribbon protein involved in translation (DUF1610 family)